MPPARPRQSAIWRSSAAYPCSRAPGESAPSFRKPAKNVRAVAREERAPRQRRAQAHVQVHLHGPDLSVHRQVRHGRLHPPLARLPGASEASDWSVVSNSSVSRWCFQLFQRLVEIVAEAAVDARPGTRLPGLIASADAAVARDVGCVVFAAVAKAFTTRAQNLASLPKCSRGTMWLPSSGVTIFGSTAPPSCLRMSQGCGPGSARSCNAAAQRGA